MVRRDEMGRRPTTATIRWDTGATVVVGGVVLIGRDPVASPGEHVDRRLAVDADSVGVSKTHALLAITTAGIDVTDRFSTNGVRIVRADGSEERCTPGVPTAVSAGEQIRFGGRSITVESS